MLKTTCGIVNIGRQSAMDYDALSEKLKKNEIAGAILDVFSPVSYTHLTLPTILLV